MSQSVFQCWDNEEACPECGFNGARFSEGLFNLAGEVAAAIDAPDLTHAILKSIAVVAEELYAGNITPEGAATRIRNVSPKFAVIFRNAMRFGLTAVVFVSAAAGIYSASGACCLKSIRRGEGAVTRASRSTAALEPAARKAVGAASGSHRGPEVTLDAPRDQEPQNDLAERHAPAHPSATPHPHRKGLRVSSCHTIAAIRRRLMSDHPRQGKIQTETLPRRRLDRGRARLLSARCSRRRSRDEPRPRRPAPRVHRAVLLEKEADPDPIAQFDRWFSEAQAASPSPTP